MQDVLSILLLFSEPVICSSVNCSSCRRVNDNEITISNVSDHSLSHVKLIIVTSIDEEMCYILRPYLTDSDWTFLLTEL
jgi:hypothetical protein